MSDSPFYSNAMNKAGEITQEFTENAKNTISNYASNASVVMGLIFVIILCFFVAFGLYFLIARTIFNQSRITIPETKIPVICNTYTKLSIENYNKSGNGKRRSYTFWIYINDMNKYPGVYKHVFHIGDSTDITQGSPYVFLDKIENKMYVRFASTENDTFKALSNKAPPSSVQNLNQADLDTFMRQGIVIPYIPIQRWVHIAIVVNENSNGGTITAYVDGDLSKIVTSNDMEGSDSKPVKVRNLDLDREGALHIGGSVEATVGPGFSGLVSKISMFNYDLNDRDIYNNYNEGPLDGFLASLGLANYGLRSPIYKIV